MTGRIWFFCTIGSPYVDSTPQTPSMTERSTPKSRSMRAKKRRELLRLLLAGDDAPVGDATVEILPELFVEFGLIADRLKPGGVGTYPAHDPRVSLRRDAARERLGAKRGDPLIERRARVFRARASWQHQSRKRAGDDLERCASGNVRRRSCARGVCAHSWSRSRVRSWARLWPRSVARFVPDSRPMVVRRRPI